MRAEMHSGRMRATLAVCGLTAAVISLTLLALSPSGSAAQDAERGNAEHGKQLFYAHGCYGCHGYNGETGARDLVGTGSPIVSDEDTFLTFLRLRADQAPVAPSTRMPNFPVEALSDADARDIFAYIRTFKLDAPRVEDVPVLRQILEAAQQPQGGNR